ncbi:hypothetical protein [Nitrosopumilus sp.]|uniref:hypothetical protein n=1 Tax=Nitrosopumilus sp. TaxID=2024843 RepID=UPI00263A3AC6|nr:hypothetical protein [Nitrosopumilus sp.]
MDEKLLKKIEQKIQDMVSDKEHMQNLSSLISSSSDSQSFVFGIVVGRLYNSFFYQSKRILNREPTEQEIQEFLKFVESKKSVLESLR